jgi:surface polysaccharide O-acyltransferase-like enzyme
MLHRSSRYDRNTVVRNDLSIEAKQTFQVVALLATILVVGIHYKSDVPNFADPALSSWNELGQEFLFGGIGRVAVPLFAFAAGFFYFRSDDGSLASYRKKLKQRLRSVLFPFFIIGSVAMASWLVVRRIEGNPVDLTIGQFFATWLLRPPAVQLWFLRDLMVLVTVAPAIRWLGRKRSGICALSLLAALWIVNWQIFPVVAGWRLLHLETLLFFVLGFAAVSHTQWIQRVGRASSKVLLGSWALWCGLIASRIYVRADFDIWYIADYGFFDLILHQASIIVGSVTLFMTAWRIRCEFLIQLSGASFFVYLVHEFPLRAVVERFSDRFLDHSTSCWIVTPLVITSCFATAMLLNRFAPSLVAMITGGRTPMTAARLADLPANNPNTPAHAS